MAMTLPFCVLCLSYNYLIMVQFMVFNLMAKYYAINRFGQGQKT